MNVVKGLQSLRVKLRVLQEEARRQAQKSVVVGYTAPYALYVHENVEMKLKGQPRSSGRGRYWDPQGKATAKFLEAPTREMQEQLGELVASTVKKTGKLEMGLLTAGLLLQRESQKRCPVETGNLKNSAYTRVE